VASSESLGAEMMDNWDFADGTIDPWSATDAIVTNDSFRLKIEQTAANGRAYTSIDSGLTEDAPHRISLDVEIGTADTVKVYTVQGGFETAITEDGYYEFDVVLRNYNSIRIYAGGANGQYAHVDNFSVKEIL